DLNVTIKDGKIIDDTKIKKSIPTIKYLLNNNAKVLIMSHLGKVKTEEDKIDKSLNIVAIALRSLMNEEVYFVNKTRGVELETALDTHNLVLMENTRYEDIDGKKESGCDMELATYWASLGEVFINDSFGTTHRKHASNYGISSILPSGYGFLINEELTGLDPIINNIKRPFTVIMGGAKVDDKVALIETLLEESDYILLGGGIANTFLKSAGYNIGTSLYSEEYVEKIKDLVRKYRDKIIMPIDVVVKEHDQVYKTDTDAITTDSAIFDIGDKTNSLYKEYLKKSETIFVNGTMGLYEDEQFRNGTEHLYQELSNVSAIKIAGGGDAVASINKLNYADVFDFLSTGGGATLEYIVEKKINCFGDK
ncbi:MAG: phosphoglycerate kinase, partial [Bacilli bacterium]|nr:phosphoglycerate kinase [Bacilli bacterium]